MTQGRKEVHTQLPTNCPQHYNLSIEQVQLCLCACPQSLCRVLLWILQLIACRARNLAPMPQESQEPSPKLSDHF